MSDFDDETQYWEHPAWDRTGEIPAVPAPATSARSTGRHAPVGATGRFERTRTHHVVRSAPVVDDGFDDLDGDWSPVDHWVEPELDGARRFPAVDPRLIRLGAVVVAAVLMIPVALALRSKPDDKVRADAATTTTSPAAAAPPAVAATPSTVAAGPSTVTVGASTSASAAAPSALESASRSSASARSSSAAAVASKPKKPKCAGTYTVIANDYWNRFPTSSGASVSQWLAANNATASTPLYVGDKLCIPAGAKAPAAPPTTAKPSTTTPTTAAPAPATTKAPVIAAAPQPPATGAAPATTKPPAPAPTAAPAPAPAPPAPPVTTAAPAPPPAPAPAPKDTSSPAAVEAMIREIWPDDIEDRAVTIAKRESHLDPSVHNYCCYGVFAIYFDMGKNFLPQMGITSPQQLLDARTNILAAYKLYTIAGWKPWAQTDPGA